MSFRVTSIAVAVVVAGLGNACGHSTHASAWTSCPPPDGRADIRLFRVRGGETCEHARRVLTHVAFHSKGCAHGCRHDGYTCLEHLARHTQANSGLSLFTYVDDVCTRGDDQAAWRIVFH